MTSQELYPAAWWQVLDKERIQCDLCPRHCQLKNGVRGFCFVRQNVDGKMVLTTYGRSSGFCVDPIEKKPLFHFYPGQPILSFGTAGCNLGCAFCQNWDISKAREMDTLQAEATPMAIANYAKALGCVGVAFTYNDPVIYAEYAIDVAKACQDLGLKTVAVTAGYITDRARSAFFDVMDAANVDLKAFTQTFYKRLCKSDLSPVLETLLYLKEQGKTWFEVTNLLIPGENDAPDEWHEMLAWIVTHLGKNVPLHFTAFHPDYRMTDKSPTSKTMLETARNLALSKGLRYVYTGNVVDVDGGTTYCPGCKMPLIVRDWHQLVAYRIKGGACSACHYPIAGHFQDSPGTWGRRRLPVSF